MRALLLALLLVACAAQTQTEPQTEAPMAAAFELDGTQWRRADDDEAAPHFPTIDFANGRASGYGGCNRWFASVTQDGASLSFGGVGATRMACPPPAMAAEQRMFDALSRTAAYRVDAEELTLLDANGDIVARFVRNDQSVP